MPLLPNTIRIPLLAFLSAGLLFSAVATAESAAGPTEFFDIDSPWSDEEDQEVRLSRYKGKALVVTIAYTTCPTVCHFTVENLKRIDKAANLAGLKPQFLIFTIDPGTDRPPALKEFMAKKGLTESHWHFLTGSLEETHRVVKILGLNFGEKGQSSHIMHSMAIVLIDGHGKVVRFVAGLKPDISSLIQDLKKLK
jgi:protein SCO1